MTDRSDEFAARVMDAHGRMHRSRRLNAATCLICQVVLDDAAGPKRRLDDAAGRRTIPARQQDS